MQENVGNADRSVRFILGPSLMGLGLTALGARQGRSAGLASIVTGALILESAITRVCPVNFLLGIDTREKGF